MDEYDVFEQRFLWLVVVREVEFVLVGSGIQGLGWEIIEVGVDYRL